MAIGTVYMTNKTQAVRIPKAVAFPDHVKKVEVKVVGDSRVITPVVASWEEWFEGDHGIFADDDFLADRDQGIAEERQPLD